MPKVAREVVIALPAGLPLAQQEALVRGFAESLARRHGIAVQWDIHAPSKAGDQRNVHAHLLLTTRRIEAGLLKAKTRELDVKPASGQHLKAWRQDWETRVNNALDQAGSMQRVDCRSHAQRWHEDGLAGEAPEPMAHLGPARTALERRGRRTRAGRYNASMEETSRLQNQIAALDRQLAHLRRRDRPSKAIWHAGRAARASGRLVSWTVGVAVVTTLNLAGARLRQPRLPTWVLRTAAASAAGLAVETSRAIGRALRRWRDRRKIPTEMRAYWRAVTRHRAPVEIERLRNEAFATLARRYPNQVDRWAALRAAEAALPRAFRASLLEVAKATKEAKLTALSRGAVDRASNVLTDTTHPRLVDVRDSAPALKAQTAPRPRPGRDRPEASQPPGRPVSRRPRDRAAPER